MINKKLKRLLGAFLCLFLLTSALTAYAIPLDEGTMAAPNSFAPTALPTFEAAAEQEVKIIIEMDSPSLLERRAMQRIAQPLDAYLASAGAEQALNSIEDEQQDIYDQLSANPEIDVEPDKEYSVVLNGISVIGSADNLEHILELDGVADAYISGFYELPQTQAIDLSATSNITAIGAMDVHQAGFTGQGMAIAVLDSGCDIDHEAFGAVEGAKFELSDISTAIANNKLSIGKLSSSVVYQNSKFPFTYDYADTDTNVNDVNSHGTHVAGIAAANQSDIIEGVAPDAQLIIMKVFGDVSDGAYDSDILAALEDAVLLGVDAINLSLGSVAGFSSDANRRVNEIYELIEAAGIPVYASAGNEYSSTYENEAGNHLPQVENPDNGVAGSPSTYDSLLSVASVNNEESVSPYILAGQAKIPFLDAAEDSDLIFADNLNGSYSYQYCGYGTVDDFAGRNLSGQIALIQRGGPAGSEALSFVEKEDNAQAAGAVGVIIFDNVEGSLVSMVTSGKIPSVFISKVSGELLNDAATKSLQISADFIDSFQDAFSGRMSDFSSWGATSDLLLKPEITAPGGDIYSTFPDDRYGNKSGTSMSSPHMLGAYALMEQYIDAEMAGTTMLDAAKAELINAIFMSTAEPLSDENGVFYSPRKQGAGLVQVNRAIEVEAYLLNNDGDRPKGELGEDANGSYDFGFELVSLSEQQLDYTVEVHVLTEDTVRQGGVDYIAQSARTLSAAEITVSAPATISLAAGQSQGIDIGLSLTEQGRQNLDSSFPNGIFIEGYVRLIPQGEGSVPLSYPFMGFYGDWQAAPLFDSDIFDEQAPIMTDTVLGEFDNYTGAGYLLGTNTYVIGADDYKEEFIAIKGSGNSNYVTAAVSLLRNADNLTYQVKDSEGNLVYSEKQEMVAKTHYLDDINYYTPMADKGFKPVDLWGDTLPDGNYTYQVIAELGGQEESISFPLVVDSELPKLISAEVIGHELVVSVQDNHYVQAASLTVGYAPLNAWAEPVYTTAGGTAQVKFDLSDEKLKGIEQAQIALIDYAGNTFISQFVDIEAVELPPANEPIDGQLIAPATVAAGADIPFSLQLANMDKVATVALSFAKDADLSIDEVLGEDGFTSLGEIIWDKDNQNKGLIVFGYLDATNRTTGYTAEELTSIGQLIASTTATEGQVGISITGLAIAGYDQDGNSVWLNSKFDENKLNTGIKNISQFDLNMDGELNLLDLTHAQQYYRQSSTAANWSDIANCDIDGSGLIDIVDLILLLQQIY